MCTRLLLDHARKRPRGRTPVWKWKEYSSYLWRSSRSIPFMELRQKTMTGDYVLCMITSKQGWMVQPVESPMWLDLVCCFMCGRQSCDRNFKLLFYLFCHFLRPLTKGNVNHEECTDNVISYQFHVQSCLNRPYLITIVKLVIYMFGWKYSGSDICS